MKQTTIAAIIAGACLWAGGASVSEQPPADCKPNPLNIPGAPYPCIFPDNRVMFRVSAPDAQKVRVRVGAGFDMSKGPDGLWYVTTTPQVVGFHYYTLSIDGAVGADPATRTFFGSGFYNSAIEVPDPDGDYFSLKDVPRGEVRQRWYSLQGHRRVAAHLRLHAARLRPQHEGEVSRVVSAARVGRERAGLVHAGPRRRDHGQPDCGEKSQAHDHRHGQPERSQAG